MTDWLRVIGWTVLGVIVALGLLATGWIVWSKHKLSQFRFTDPQLKAIQESQRGKRPMWRDPIAPRSKEGK